MVNSIGLLEVNSTREAQFAAGVCCGARDFTERTTGYAGRRIAKLRRVGQVQSLAAEDKDEALGDVEAPGDAEAGIGDTRPAHRVSSRRSEAAKRDIRCGVTERSAVIGFFHRQWIGEIRNVEVRVGSVVAAKNHIRPGGLIGEFRAAGSARPKSVSAAGNRHGSSALAAERSGERPASQDISRRAVLQERLPLSERKRIAPKDLEVVRPIDIGYSVIEFPIGIRHRDQQVRLAIGVATVVVDPARPRIVHRDAVVAREDLLSLELEAVVVARPIRYLGSDTGRDAVQRSQGFLGLSLARRLVGIDVDAGNFAPGLFADVGRVRYKLIGKFVLQRQIVAFIVPAAVVHGQRSRSQAALGRAQGAEKDGGGALAEGWRCQRRNSSRQG